MRVVFALLALWSMALAPAGAVASTSVFLEELTWTEVRDALRDHKTTIIIPVGGTEQNGPHMALGKHNVRVKALAGKIASTLGNALVAPVVAYVPEGRVTPPSGHMRFAGTISIPDDVFKALLEASGRSFKRHGFVDVVLIGDSGNYQAELKAVATKLNREWAATPARAHFITDYYRAVQADYVQALRAKGLNDAQIGTHAGSADTSLLMAVDATLVRADRLALAAREGAAGGAAGDPRASSAALGLIGVDLIVEHTVTAIRHARGAPR